MPKNFAIETAENQLMALRGIRHSEFAVGKSPRRIADSAERVLFC